jgi:AmmeMemoRadiSam system protein B
MKIQLLLTNKRAPFIVSLTIIALLAVIVRMPVKSPKLETIYHQSQWNEYAPEIDKVASLTPSVKPLDLKRVYGGVVSHHIPTTIPKLVDFYRRLKATQTVNNFIIIGPDHTDAGREPISISNASFFTIYGEVIPINNLAQKLNSKNLVNIDEAPFDLEHSVGSQILIISKIFPDSRVTPIIVRSDVSENQARALGQTLSSYIDDETVVIVSVDFSHYLSTNQAMPLDQISGEVLQNLDLGALSLVTVDSVKSTMIFMEIMNINDARDTDNFTVLNTNDLMQNSDYTTGYVFGYWGDK